MAKDERGPAREIGRWLRGLERSLSAVLAKYNITAEERAIMTARRGMYDGIADDIDRMHHVDSKGPELTNAEVGMGRLAGSAKFDQIRCYDEHSAKRMLAAAPGMECRLCPKPSEIFIAIPNEWGFNVRPGYCLEHGEAMLRPYENSTVTEHFSFSEELFSCCGGNDEKPPHHCSDCPTHPWTNEPPAACMSSPSTCPHAVPRYYEAIGPSKDTDESKRLEGVINNIVHEVLEESSHAPDCDSFDFDPEQQLGPDKPCNCWKSKK